MLVHIGPEKYREEGWQAAGEVPPGASAVHLPARSSSLHSYPGSGKWISLPLPFPFCVILNSALVHTWREKQGTKWREREKKYMKPLASVIARLFLSSF